MDKQTLITIRDFLFKTFLIGLLIAVLLMVISIILWEPWSLFINNKFLVTEEDLGKMFVNSFLYLRFYLLFIILSPAIALHWLVISKKK